MKNETEKIVDNLIGVSNCGTHLRYNIQYKANDKNIMEPYYDKPINQYEMIQAAQTSCDINQIVKRAQCGDISVLNVREALYGDVSDIPTNVNDMHQVDVNAINDFNNLPKAVKEAYGYDFNNYKDSVIDGSYVDVIKNALMPKENVEVKEENK